MKIEEHGNGYRVRKMYKGKTYTAYFDHKPSQKEIMLALSSLMEGGGTDKGKGSVEEAAEKYINDRRERGLSPSTLIGYKSSLRNTPEWFLKLNAFDVDQKDLEKLIAEYSKTHSPKTVSNLSNFYKVVFRFIRPKFVYRVEIPKRVKKMKYEPTTRDVMDILDYAKGSRHSVFLQLAVLGVRRGEIAALTLSDLNGSNVLTVNKDMIKSEGVGYEIKEIPKTSASNRRILIPSGLADEIRAKGFIHKGDIAQPYKYLQDVQKALGIPRFPLHILRHFAAAYLNKMGFTRDQILQFCGWEKSSNVMERIYSYNLDPEESQRDISDAFDNLF
ncbi:MAG: hypothetical protein IJP84_09210 [Lachnospiraceae bacterium]|nr:hypothetical protein [Lachnospiraceae bacterium]